MSSARARRTFALRCALLACAPLSGCALLAPAPAEPTKELLDQTPAAVPRAGRRAGVLVVLVAPGAPLYDTNAIAYRRRGGEIAFFADHQWAERPSRMLLPLAVSTLQRTEAFGAVLSAPYFGRAATLRLDIDELLADFSAPSPALRFAVRAVLREDAGGLATRTLRVDEPLAGATPVGVVRAANSAVAKALLEIARFVTPG